MMGLVTVERWEAAIDGYPSLKRKRRTKDVM
jgi:hypothetical protein